MAKKNVDQNTNRDAFPEDSHIVNEEETELLMSSQTDTKHKTSVATVVDDLSQLYKFALNGDFGFTNVFDLNSYNPFLQNSRLKTLSTQPNDIGRDNLINCLARPGESELQLRQQGWALSVYQYLYYKILRFASDIPNFKYYKIPQLLSKKLDYSSKEFKEEDAFVDDWLRKFDVVNTLKRVSLEVKREGKCTYVLRNSAGVDDEGNRYTNYATWQKLPSDYVKLTGIGEHGYTASFNFMVFVNPAYSPKQFPKFMQEIWEDLIHSGVVQESDSRDRRKAKLINGSRYELGDNFSQYKYDFRYGDGQIETLNGSLEIRNIDRRTNYAFWVPLPQDLCYTFCSDTSNVWTIPDTSGLFLGLQELADYDVLAGLIQSTPLTALLTAEIETIPNPNAGRDQTIIHPDTVALYQEKFNSSSSTNLEAFFAPFKNFKLLSLPSSPNSSEITTNATRNFVDRAGMGGLIITTEKPSVAQVKGAQLLEEAQCDFLTKQFESVLEMIINKLIGTKFKWKLSIWGYIFSFSEELKRTKEAVIAGSIFMLPKLASADGLTMRDVQSLNNYVDSLGVYDHLKTMTQITQSKMKQEQDQAEGTSSTGAVGRPSMSDDEIESDNTAASKDSGLDTADMRYGQGFDGKCLLCGQDSDGPLCDECREKMALDSEEDEVYELIRALKRG